jgi:hypothetical protein
MSKHFYWIGLVLGLLPTALIPQEAQAVSLSLLPSAQTIVVGETTTVDVEISGLGNFQSPSLSSFDLKLNYNPSILQFLSADFNIPGQGNLVDLSDNPNLRNVDTTMSGMIKFSEVSFNSAVELNGIQPSSFILTRFNFRGTNVGTVDLTLQANELLDEDELNPMSLLPLDSPPNSASITINSNGGVTTPEPNFSLVGLGLMVLAGMIVKQKKSS